MTKNFLKLFFSFIFIVSLSINKFHAESISQNSEEFSVLESEIISSEFSGNVLVTQKTENGYDVLYQYYSDEMSADSLYDVGSISKLFTTLAIMHLEEEGKLQTSDEISLYLEDIPSDEGVITIEELLTHSSGINLEESIEEMTKEEALNRIYEEPLGYAPGDNYSYSNSNFTLLAAIVENVTQEDFPSYMEDNIFKPLNLKSTGFSSSEYLDSTLSTTGYYNDSNTGLVMDYPYDWRTYGYTGVVTTTHDLNLMFQELIHGYYLTDESVDKIVNPYFETSSNKFRGLGVSISDNGTQTIIGHPGVWYGGNSAIGYRPEDGITFVALSNEIWFPSYYPSSVLENYFFDSYPIASLETVEPIESVNIEDELEVPEENVNSEVVQSNSSIEDSEIQQTNENNVLYLIMLLILLIITVIALFIFNQKMKK